MADCTLKSELFGQARGGKRLRGDRRWLIGLPLFAIWNGIEETLDAIHRAGGEPNWDSCEAIRDARWLHFRGIEQGRTRYSYL